MATSQKPRKSKPSKQTKFMRVLQKEAASLKELLKSHNSVRRSLTEVDFDQRVKVTFLRAVSQDEYPTNIFGEQKPDWWDALTVEQRWQLNVNLYGFTMTKNMLLRKFRNIEDTHISLLRGYATLFSTKKQEVILQLKKNFDAETATIAESIFELNELGQILPQIVTMGDELLDIIKEILGEELYQKMRDQYDQWLTTFTSDNTDGESIFDRGAFNKESSALEDSLIKQWEPVRDQLQKALEDAAAEAEAAAKANEEETTSTETSIEDAEVVEEISVTEADDAKDENYE